MKNHFSFLTTAKFWGITSAVLLVSLGLVGSALMFGRPGVEAAAPPVAMPAYQPQSVTTNSVENSSAEDSNAENSSAENSTENSATVSPENDESLMAAAPEKVQPVSANPQQTGSTSYAGNVLAADKVPVAVEVIGQVLQLNVGVGDAVIAGDVLLEIDSTTLKAQRAQALAGLQAAEAQLAGVQLDADASDVEAARAGVAAANAAYQRAIEGPSQEDLDIAEAQMRQAQAAVKQTRAAYNEIKWMPQIAMMPQSLALEQATLQFEAAQAQYEKVTQGATQDVISGAYAQIAAAKSQLDRLLNGANEPQIDAVRAQVRQAETSLLLADIQVDKATVRAPITGVVNQVNTSAGANVAPGGPVFEILSNDVKVVVNVEEFHRGDVYVGQPAIIQVNAYADRTFEGEVATIAPSLDAATRTFEVTVRPTSDASDLAPGMFATVELGQ